MQIQLSVCLSRLSYFFLLTTLAFKLVRLSAGFSSLLTKCCYFLEHALFTFLSTLVFPNFGLNLTSCSVLGPVY